MNASTPPLTIESWQMVSPGEPLVRNRRTLDAGELSDDEAVVEVVGCGVCHTDLGFLFEGVRTRHPLPLTLGHEIAGIVRHVGADAHDLVGRPVIVPAVLPCGSCDACQRGRGAICSDQIFPGNDVHGGFASHVVVPARGLCPVDAERLEAAELELADLAVVADAVTTPYQAIVNAGLQAGDVAIFIGVGGVGGFGVQIARALDAHVVAIDVDPARLTSARERGVELALVSAPPGGPAEDRPEALEAREIRKRIRSWVSDGELPATGWKIFECSGHPDGQRLAWRLLTYDAHLGVVGYTRERIEVRLSNLMAFDATARGTWGCLPEHYPAVVDLVLDGEIDVSSAVERHPMSEINDVFTALREHRLDRRPVLIPDFGDASVA